jgi:hypothetical protein
VARNSGKTRRATSDDPNKPKVTKCKPEYRFKKLEHNIFAAVPTDGGGGTGDPSQAPH